MIFLFISCEKINQFYDEPSNEERVALANQKYEAITEDTNFYKEHTVYERAVIFDRELNEIKDLDPENKKAVRSLSNAYLRKGLFKEWKYYMDKLLFMDPASNQGSRAYTLMYQLRAYRKALNDFYGVKAAHKGPYYIRQINLDYLIAICHMQLGENESALEYFEKYRKHETIALGESYLYSSYYLYRAKVFFNMGDAKKAIEVLDQGMKRNPDFADYYFFKAEIRMAEKQFDKAQLLNEKALHFFENVDQRYRYRGSRIEDLYYEDIMHQKENIRLQAEKEL